MSNINEQVAKVVATFGQGRVELLTDSTGRQTVVALARPQLMMNKSRFAETDLLPIPADKAGYRTRIIPIEGATHIGSFPLAGVGALGVQRAGMQKVAHELDMNKLVVKHYSYIAFLDNPTKPIADVAEIIKMNFGSVEHFNECAFITFETLDVKIALGIGGQYRLAIAKSEEEQKLILQNFTKFSYKRVTKPDGTVVVDSTVLVPATYNGSALIFKGSVFTHGTTAKTADGTELSAFKTYRCGTNVETGELVYEEGTYAQKERSTTTYKSTEDIQSKYSTSLLATSRLQNSAEFSKDVETPASNTVASDIADFDYESATLPQLKKFLIKNAGKTTADLKEMPLEQVRALAEDLVLSAEA